MAIFKHNGFGICYEQWGEGPAVVLCHGLTSDHEKVKQLVDLPPGYTVLSWDCRGHGESDTPDSPDGYGFGVFADDLAALMEDRGIAQAAVVGLSMGAAVAAALAAAYPQKLRALALVRPAWLDRPNPRNLAWMPVLGDLLMRFGAEEGLRRLEADRKFHEVQREAPNLAEGLRQQFFQPRAVERALRLKYIPASSPIGDFRDVQKLKVPALVIGNEADPLHPLEFAQEWARQIPGAQLRQVISKSIDLPAHNRACREHVIRFLQGIAS